MTPHRERVRRGSGAFGLAVVVVLVSVGCAAAGDRPGVADAVPSATPRQLFVAPGGDDASPGDIDAPWRSLAVALARLRPGDTLRIREGRYTERITNVAIRPGSESARITVEAFPGEEAVIEGLFWLHRPDYWTIRRVHVTWHDGDDSGDHMVKLIDGVGWRFEENELSSARSYAALLIAGTTRGRPTEWSVTGNCIHDTRASNDTNQDHLVYANTGLDAGAGVIDGNLLFSAPNGTGIKLGGSRENSGGAAHVTVVNNTIWRARQSILVAWRSRDIAIERNIMGGTGAAYGAVRGYQLSGSRVTASDNVVFDVATPILNDRGFRGVKGSKNRVRDPEFDTTSGCDGFRPAVDLGAGHLASR